MLFNIDIAIVIIFLSLTLVIGMGHGKSVRSIKDYALGGRNFSTGALVATIVATYASGSGFFTTLTKTYTSGFYLLFASIGMGLSMLITAYILIPRMAEFMGKTSIAEAMGSVYGSKVRIMTAIAGAIGSAGSIAVQFKVFGNVVAYFIGISPSVAIIASSIVTIVYSVFGGIRAVTFTDVFQGFTFGVIIPLLGFAIWNQFYDLDCTIAHALNDPKFSLGFFNPSSSDFWSFIFLFMYFIMPSISAVDFQRISMGRDIAQVKKAFAISAVILILIKFSIAWIPFLTYAIDPNIEANRLLPYIVDTFSFTGLKGLIIIAIIAFAISTADSRINASSVLFAHDIYGLFSKDKKNELLVAKIFGALLGLGTIILSLVETELLSIIVFSNSFYFPLVSPPFLLSLFGFRSSSKSVLIGMAAGLICTVLWKIVPMEWSGIAQELYGLLFAILCNTVFLFGSHYILRQPGGWVGIKDRTYLEEQKITSQKKKTDFNQHVNNFSIRKICQRIAPHSDITYTTLGVYFIVCTITTMYSTHVELIGANGQLMKIIYPLMLITGTTISMYQIWPLSVPTNIKKNIIETWYPVAIFYMLIFFSCFFVLVSKFAMLQVVLFATNLIVAALLLGWRLALPSIIVGFFLAINFYQYFFGETGFAVQFGSPEFILIYALLFLSSVVIFFLKPEQEYQEATEVKAVYLEKEVYHLGQKVGHLEFHAEARKKELSKAFELKYEFLRNLQHEAHTPIMGITSMGEVLYECYDKLTDEQRKKYLKDISQSSTRLNSYINNMIDLSKLSSMNYEFHRELINFGELVRERAEICKKLYSDGKYQGKQTIILMLEDNVTGYFDRYYISQVIDNIIINAIQYCKEGEITIILSQDNETIKFSVSDEGIGIPQEDLYDIFGAFTVSSKTKTSAGGRGVGLALCKKIIDLNNGVISAKQNDGKGVTFSFILPKK